jgi:hypothetical protein
MDVSSDDWLNKRLIDPSSYMELSFGELRFDGVLRSSTHSARLSAAGSEPHTLPSSLPGAAGRLPASTIACLEGHAGSSRASPSGHGVRRDVGGCALRMDAGVCVGVLGSEVEDPFARHPHEVAAVLHHVSFGGEDRPLSRQLLVWLGEDAYRALAPGNPGDVRRRGDRCP